MPKTTKPAAASPRLAALAAELFRVGDELDRLATRRSALERRRAELEARVLKSFSASELEGVRVAGGVLTRRVDPVPQVEDWNKLYRFIRAHDAFELLHRRVSSGAWLERLEAGEAVPGVKTFNRVTLQLRRARRR